MNQFFELFSGPIALLSSIIAALVLARRWKGNRHTRRFLVGLLYWGPSFLISCMVMHSIRNGYNTIMASVESGKVVFAFYHYSLQLFGVVVAYQALVLLKKCRRHTRGTKRFNRSISYSLFLILITTLPTLYFTPIGIIPVPVLLITLVASVTVHKSSAIQKTPAASIVDNGYFIAEAEKAFRVVSKGVNSQQ